MSASSSTFGPQHPSPPQPNPERIYLEPGNGRDDGRMWCADDVWSGEPDYAEAGPAVAYVRADLVGEMLGQTGTTP